MKYDIILCGVGGQGGLSISVVIARAAMAAGLRVKQSEIHGMAQRGGEVLAHLRLSDMEPASPTIPLGTASLILAFEPLESLRYLAWLSGQAGILVSGITPIRNIVAYPDIEVLLSRLRALPRSVLLDAEAIAREAGNPKAANVVLVGAASKYLPVPTEYLRTAIAELFARKGDAVTEANLRAFEYGQKANP